MGRSRNSGVTGSVVRNRLAVEEVSPEDYAKFNITIPDLLDEVVAEYPDKEFAFFPATGIRVTFRQFREKVEETARGLISLGVEPGDHVAIWAAGCLEWLLVQHAASRIGAVIVTVNTNFKASELEYVLKQSESSTFFIGPGFRALDYPAIFSKVCPELAASEPGKLSAARLPKLKRVVFMGQGRPSGMYAFTDVLSGASAVSPLEIDAKRKTQSPDDPVHVVYTSGTTGFPKGALLHHAGLIGIGYWLGWVLHMGPEDRMCMPLPIFSSAGVVGSSLLPMRWGASIVIHDNFDPLKVLQTLQDERCTLVFGVTTMYIAMMEHPEFPKFKLNLKKTMMSGAPCPVEVMKQIEANMGLKLVVGCGLTETSGAVTFTRMEDPPELRLTTAGRPVPGFEVKIVGINSGEDLPPGTQGEMVYRGWGLMKGYYKMPDATGSTIDADGWLHSGDLAIMNDQGYFNITGRLKDMIIRGGQNIYSKEIEELLYTHPKLAEGYIVGVPDRKYGEELMAALRLKDGERCAEDEIREFLRQRVARYKVPKYVMFMKEFPLTATGKAQKFKITEIGVKHFGLEREREASA